MTSRPSEGDLIYLPFKNSTLLEIKYVDDRYSFYQIGDYYVYSLTCEAFQYAHEPITTGIKDVDNPISSSLNTKDYEILDENGGAILTENGGSLILDSFDIDQSDWNANNNQIQTESQSIIDSTEQNMFGFK
jgi:hypothetical protein